MASHECVALVAIIVVAAAVVVAIVAIVYGRSVRVQKKGSEIKFKVDSGADDD